MPRMPIPPTASSSAGSRSTTPTPHPTTHVRGKIGTWVESTPVQTFIISVILLNSVILGLETSPTVMAAFGGTLHVLDKICLGVFVVEIGLKLFAQRWRFFRDGWNVFDFLIVGIALVPGTGSLSALRALRVLRVLRLVSVVPKLRFIVTTLLAAIPGIASISALLCIIYYVFAVMATGFFGGSFPEWFGSIGKSLYSLFQIMTLESWSMGIVRPVMVIYPWAWAFFVPFILLSAFTILNLFIAVIIDTMQNLNAEYGGADGGDAAKATDSADADLIAEIDQVKAQLESLTKTLESRTGKV